MLSVYGATKNEAKKEVCVCNELKQDENINIVSLLKINYAKAFS